MQSHCVWWNVRHFSIVAVSYCQLDFQQQAEFPPFRGRPQMRSSRVQFVKCWVCFQETVSCYHSPCPWWKIQLIYALTAIPNISPWLAAVEVLKNIFSPPLPSGSWSSDNRRLCLKHDCNCNRHTVWYAVRHKDAVLPAELPWATCPHSPHICTSDDTHARRHIAGSSCIGIASHFS